MSTLAGTLFVNQATANPWKPPGISHPKPSYCSITVLSPENETYGKDAVLKLIVVTNFYPTPYIFYCYTLDKRGEEIHKVWNDPELLKLEERIISQIEITNDSDSKGVYDTYLQTTYEFTANLRQLSYGEHNITIYWGIHKLQTFYFTMSVDPLETSELVPSTLVATVSGVSVAIVGLGLLVYFKKRKR